MLSRIARLVIAAFILFFCSWNIYRCVTNLMHGQWMSLGLLFCYAVVLVLFMFQRPARESTQTFRHWLTAMSGTFLPLFFSPSSQSPKLVADLGIAVQFVGTWICLLSLISLGRSFGVIAARRIIKTDGMYKIVRHPIYASEVIMNLGVVMQNFSYLNIAVLVLQVLCQIRRIRDEEALLMNDEDYVQFTRRTTYRLIPGIF
jgi:protein-S-isoprenylcysteine O-methyltransferase Ste14